MNAHDEADVIVVGAGFSGVAAARELRHAGHSCVVLEARDRLGGRTWTDVRLGHQMELGGTWVHWLQPHVWAEITRYGAQVVPSPEPAKIGWTSASGSQRWMSPDEFFGWLDDGQSRSLADAAEVFPLPFDPYADADAVAALDERTVADRLRELGLEGEDYEVNHTMWSMHFNAPCDEGALTQALRWGALGRHDWRTLLEACATFKLTSGMRGLIEAMAADADVRFGTHVTAVDQTADEVVVSTSDGEEFRGRAAIVAVPLNTLGAIDFAPALPPEKQALIDEGQASRGLKLWIRVRGRHDPLIAVAAPPNPINLIQAEYWVDDATLFVAFGIEGSALEISDHEAVEVALRRLLPDAEVEACEGHDWTGDSLSRGGWGMLRPGQLSRYMRRMQDPEGRVVFAGSDLATGWAGFVDGAIERGIVTARSVGPLLGGSVASASARALADRAPAA